MIWRLYLIRSACCCSIDAWEVGRRKLKIDSEPVGDHEVSMSDIHNLQARLEQIEEGADMLSALLGRSSRSEFSRGRAGG